MKKFFTNAVSAKALKVSNISPRFSEDLLTNSFSSISTKAFRSPDKVIAITNPAIRKIEIDL